MSELNTSTDPQLTREEAIEILNTPDDKLEELIKRAEVLRRKYKGNHVSIHILTNARSGNCSQDCSYCAQSSRSKADIDEYLSLIHIFYLLFLQFMIVRTNNLI